MYMVIPVFVLLLLLPSYTVRANVDKTFHFDFQRVFEADAQRAAAAALKATDGVAVTTGAPCSEQVVRVVPTIVQRAGGTAHRAAHSYSRSGRVLGPEITLIPQLTQVDRIYQLTDNLFPPAETPGSARALREQVRSYREAYTHLLQTKRISSALQMQSGQGAQMTFVPITPGSYFDEDAHRRVISDEFQVSATVVSKKVWARVAQRVNLVAGKRIEDYPNNLHPAVLGAELYLTEQRIVNEVSKDRAPLQTIKTEQEYLMDQIFGQPVSNLSVTEILTWIDALNDLSVINDPLIQQLFPDHQIGDQYRLATTNEIQYLMNGAGGDQWSFRKELHARLESYANFGTGEPEAVAQRMPLVFPGGEVSDLIGNVDTLAFNAADGNYAMMGGNATLSFAEMFRAKDVGKPIVGAAIEQKNPWLGFRLVRLRNGD